MKKLFTVLKFEFAKTIKSKPFRVLTILMVVVIAGVLSFPMLQENFSGKEDEQASKDEITTIGIVNNSSYDDKAIIELFSKSFIENDVEKADESTESAKTLVKDEEYEFIVIIDDVDSYTLVTRPTGVNDNITYRINGILLDYYKIHLLSESGLSTQEAQSVINAQMQSRIVETGKNQGTSFMYTYVLVLGLYMVIIIYGQLVATSVAAEKSSRAMEVLVTTVSPIKMMFGKVIGTGFAALCQLFAVIGSGIVFYKINAEYWGMNEVINTIFNIPTETIVISIIMFVLGFFVYAFLYAAIGSLASRIEDINTSVLPITFISVASFMLVMFSMTTGNIDSTIMKVCSWFPLTSPFALLVRAAMGDLSLIESVGAIAVLLFTAIIIGYIAALIYKMGVLLYGKPPKISEIVKLIKKRKS